MTSLEYPRLLVVTSNSFGLQTGTGISLTNLFKGWPRDRIANLHREYGTPDQTVCERFFYLTEREMRWHPAIAGIAATARMVRERRRQKDAIGLPALHPGHARSTTDEAEPLEPLSRLLPQRIVDLLVVGGFADLRTEVQLTPELRAWLDDFSPEIVYSNLGDLGFVRLVRLISEHHRIPMAIQMSDDWPEGRYRSLVSRGLRGRMESELQTVLTRARLRLGICSAMCRAYEERYRVPFRACISPIETEDWLKHARNSWAISGTFRVVYMGTVHPLAQLQSLVDVGRAISEMHAEGTNIRFEILIPETFTAELRRRLRGHSGVQVGVSPTSSQAASVLAGADLLVIPANFDSASFRYTRYSLPAKAIAYMISSCPVLLYAPPSMPVVEYAREERWGFVVDRRDRPRLRQAIVTLMRDEPLRRQLGLRGREVAVRNHDGKRLRAWFHELMRRAASRDDCLDPIDAGPARGPAIGRFERR
jgi:glycosyltransferase involved in cell wall biosynthesis